MGCVVEEWCCKFCERGIEGTTRAVECETSIEQANPSERWCEDCCAEFHMICTECPAEVAA